MVQFNGEMNMIAGFDSILTIIELNIFQILQLKASSFNGPFEAEINKWDHKFKILKDML